MYCCKHIQVLYSVAIFQKTPNSSGFKVTGDWHFKQVWGKIRFFWDWNGSNSFDLGRGREMVKNLVRTGDRDGWILLTLDFKLKIQLRSIFNQLWTWWTFRRGSSFLVAFLSVSFYWSASLQPWNAFAVTVSNKVAFCYF